MGGYDVIMGMVNGMIKDQNITVPVAVHLDHGSYDALLKVHQSRLPKHHV